MKHYEQWKVTLRLRDWCCQHLQNYQVLKQILPKMMMTGKIDLLMIC